MMRTFYPPLDAEAARNTLERLIDDGKPFVLDREPKQRSVRQNSYLHLLIALVAAHTGYSIEYVKRHYYKIHCNSELFVTRNLDEYVGEVVTLRSSAELSSREMNLSITRFRNWVAADIGLYLPDPDNSRAINEAKAIVKQHQSYI